MSDKRSKFHENLDKVLNVFLGEEASEATVELAEKTLEDGTVIQYENLEPGTPVMKVVEGEDPVPMDDGEYKISDTEILVVVEGVVSEVKPVEEEMPEEETAETEMEKTENTASDIFNLDVLKQKIDFEKDGFHSIEFSISNGAIEWGNILSQSYQEMSKQLAAKEQELKQAKVEFENQLEVLGKTIKETKVKQAPVEAKTQPTTWRERKLEAIKAKRQEEQLN